MTVQTRLTTDKMKGEMLGTSRARRQLHSGARDVQAAVGEGAAVRADPKVALWSLGKFKKASRRVRKTSPGQLARVIQSVKHYGVVAPVLVDAAGEIINGHIVVEAATELGISTVPVVQIKHLDEAQVRSLRIALNRLAETGDWDMPELAVELHELSMTSVQLTDTGFSPLELDIIMLGDAEPTPKQAKADALPKPLDSIVTELGDVWQLGDHRVICGDATAPAVYEELLGSDRVHAVFGDPPYNIPIAGFVSGLGSTKHEDFVQGVGEWSPEEFSEFLRRYLDCCRTVSIPGAAIFACMDWRSVTKLQLAGEAVGLEHVNTCVWNKGSGGMGGLYRSAHEMVLVFCNGSKVATNNVALGKHGRDRCNVWNYAGANRRGTSAAKALKLHATPKPVALVEDAICDVTNRRDMVLDPFLGSGTTLVAAHTTGRVGRFIELDPKFVDVAIRRFEELTGIEAVHVATGEMFGAMARRRDAPL